MTYQDFYEEWNNSDDFIKVKTSGSTGEPRNICLSKRFVEESANRTNKFFGITSKSRLHSCISPDYIGGKMMAVRAILSGADFSWETPSNKALTDILSNQKIDLTAVVPSQMFYIIDNYEKIPKVENFIIGGAPVSSQLGKLICQKGFNAYETYGMTETASHIALRKIEYETGPFQTLSGIRVSSNEKGCLVIRFKEGKIIQTNDLARVISDSHFYITGRADNMINSGGKKICAEFLEEKLSCIVNLPFCVSSLRDEKWGERIVLLIEDPYRTTDQDLLYTQMRNILESWEVPKNIYLLDKLPRTANGKIKRLKDFQVPSSSFPGKNLFF